MSSHWRKQEHYSGQICSILPFILQVALSLVARTLSSTEVFAHVIWNACWLSLNDYIVELNMNVSCHEIVFDYVKVLVINIFMSGKSGNSHLRQKGKDELIASQANLFSIKFFGTRWNSFLHFSRKFCFTIWQIWNHSVTLYHLSLINLLS